MQWTGLNLLTLGYGTAAVLAAFAGAVGYSFGACIGIFWIGGAILTVSFVALRLALTSTPSRPRPAASNVIQLHHAHGRSALATQSGTSELHPDLGDRST